MPYGNWSGCHAVGWDYNAPEFGDLAVGDNFQKHSYPFAIMVNATACGFATRVPISATTPTPNTAAQILEQPHQFAWQIFDQQVVHLQRDEYRIRQVTKVMADTIEALADKMAEYAAVDKPAFLKTIRDYNAAVQRDIPYNPTVKDGRTTKGLAIEKTNWAMPLEKPPYEAYCTTCGVTFTFGGLRIDTDGRVLDTAQKVIPGSTRPANWSAACSISTIPAAPASFRARCSARSPGPARVKRSAAIFNRVSHSRRETAKKHVGKPRVRAGFAICQEGDRPAFCRPDQRRPSAPSALNAEVYSVNMAVIFQNSR